MTQDDTFDDETLMAYADGEADAATARRLQAALAGDPLLRARLAPYEGTRAALRQALDPLGAAPVPDRLEAAVRAQLARAALAPGGAPVRPPAAENVLPLRRPLQRPPMTRMLLPLAASLALLLGGLGGYVAGRDGGAAPTAGLAIGPALADAFATVPTGTTRDLAPGTNVRLVGSFRDGAGQLCREAVQQDGAGRLTFVGCHGAGGWQLRFAAHGGAGAATYSPASADEALDAFLRGIEAGRPLSRADEAAALQALR